ncbi:MAG: hypothetical protein E6J62_20485 [Deltaproteobacteria bacterium]|nr:MAG: hypothetical protein E6J62_20485 [Deltaproteobacteria bacterium]
MLVVPFRWRWPCFIAALALVAGGCTRSKPPEGLHAGDFVVRIAIDPDPPRAGENVLHVDVRDSQDKPVDGARVALVYDMPAMGAMPEMKGNGDSKPLGGGKYDVSYGLAMLGDWYVTVGIEAPGHAPAEVKLKVSPPRNGYTVQSHGGGSVRESGPHMLEMTPERQQLIGVVYAKVARRPLSLSLRAPGRVEVDETQVGDVVLKYDAFVEKLLVDHTGQPVKEGQPLLVLYSPDLLSAQQDYLVALRSQGAGGSEQLVRAAEERLRVWGLSSAQIAALRSGGRAEPRVTIHSPRAGVVLEKNVVAGTLRAKRPASDDEVALGGRRHLEGHRAVRLSDGGREDAVGTREALVSQCPLRLQAGDVRRRARGSSVGKSPRRAGQRAPRLGRAPLRLRQARRGAVAGDGGQGRRARRGLRRSARRGG